MIVWLAPSIAALLLYGIGQGLVKKYIEDVPPAVFCFYFVIAKAIVNLGFFATQAGNAEHLPILDPAGREFLWFGIMAYCLDGIGWILYFKSIMGGPITIVGTLSAAYPATTVLFARLLLNEVLSPLQYVGVALVILGCVALSYSPPDKSAKVSDKRWMLYAAGALILWGLAQTAVKYAYGLPNADESNLAVFNTIGGFLTLGLYGWIYGRKHIFHPGRSFVRDFSQSFLPMAMMAAGDLGVLIASRYGPISVVTPLTAAYPMVTLWFAAAVLRESVTRLQLVCVALILVGMYLSPGAA